MMGELDKHAMRRRLNGLPIYDEDGEIEDWITEPEWQWDDLDGEQRALVQALADTLAAREGTTKVEAFSFALAEYGIACPHDWEVRAAWRECLWCRVSQPLPPGRMVDIGGHQIRVTDPPPHRMRIPIAPTIKASDPLTASPWMDELEFDEYEWTGSRYVKVSR